MAVYIISTQHLSNLHPAAKMHTEPYSEKQGVGPRIDLGVGGGGEGGAPSLEKELSCRHPSRFFRYIKLGSQLLFVQIRPLVKAFGRSTASSLMSAE
jgi:hypothetical protein